MVASGFAGLGYQIVWTQQMSLWLGHEAAAVLAVITAFFGGLGVGAVVLGRHVQASPHPARWYAVCELVIAAWCLVLALAMAPISDALLALIGAEPAPLWHAAVAFIGSFLLLLPATAAMGATLPAMERVLAGVLAGVPARTASAIAAVYASNTLGAMLGVLVTAFWMVPNLGLMRTAALCAGLNVLCAGLALVLARQQALPGAETAASRHAPHRAAPRWPALVWLAATGWLGIGYEVLVVRVLSQVSENTVYTYALLLAIYLLGTAAGAAGYARWASAAKAPETMRHRLVMAVAGACALGAASLWAAEGLRDLPAVGLGPQSGFAAALLGEVLPAWLAFALPTVAMGALFSHLATQARQAGISLGLAFGANTLGAAAAPPLVGLWLLPALGAKGGLMILLAGYLLLASWQLKRWPAVAVGWAALATAAVLAPALVFIEQPEGSSLLSYREGAMASVSVVADADGVARLRINNRQQEGSSASLLADARQALLPLLLHAAPQRALFLGLGTGVTASAAAAYPGLQVDAAELLPEVIEASAWFAAADAPKPRLVAADARRFVKAAGPGYDLIVSDNFHPARSGSALLYTLEHFAAVRARLLPGGLFCQWMPLHQIDLDSLRSVVQSFMAVYPEGRAVLATNSLQTPVVGFIAQPGVARVDLQALRQRLAAAPLPWDRFALGDDFAVLGSFIAGPEALRHFAGNAPLNTDDRPVVAYSAPRITYAPDSLPADRLQSLLAALGADAQELVDAGTETAWPPRLAAYWAARDSFITAGRGVQPVADVRQMLAQVQGPLLAVLRISPDFRPAREPLQRMAHALAQADAPAAQPLLQALTEIDAQSGQALRRVTSGSATQP